MARAQSQRCWGRVSAGVSPRPSEVQRPHQKWKPLSKVNWLNEKTLLIFKKQSPLLNGPSNVSTYCLNTPFQCYSAVSRKKGKEEGREEVSKSLVNTEPWTDPGQPPGQGSRLTPSLSSHTCLTRTSFIPTRLPKPWPHGESHPRAAWGHKGCPSSLKPSRKRS